MPGTLLVAFVAMKPGGSLFPGRSSLRGLQRQMPKQHEIPHVKNVELVPDTRSHGGAPGFNFHFNLVMAAGLLAVIVVSYLVFS